MEPKRDHSIARRWLKHLDFSLKEGLSLANLPVLAPRHLFPPQWQYRFTRAIGTFSFALGPCFTLFNASPWTTFLLCFFFNSFAYRPQRFISFTTKFSVIGGVLYLRGSTNFFPPSFPLIDLRIIFRPPPKDRISSDGNSGHKRSPLLAWGKPWLRPPITFKILKRLIFSLSLTVTC